MIKTKFFQACIGISIVLVSLGFFFQSIQTAGAAPSNPQKILLGGSEASGKYQGSLAAYWDGKSLNAFALITNTETGGANFYSKNYDGDSWNVDSHKIPAQQ